ncbi:19776_t:CDS:2, partial [Racocetra persica]
QLETQMVATQTRLNELQDRYNAIPEEIRRSRKKKGEDSEKIQEQVKTLNTELQVQKVEQALEQIRQENAAQKTKEIKSDQSRKTSPLLTTKESSKEPARDYPKLMAIGMLEILEAIVSKE